VPRESTFLVVEFDGAGGQVAEFTRRHPGATVDVIQEPGVREGDDTVLPTLALVRNASPIALRDWEESVGRAYQVVSVLRREDRVGRWTGRLRIRQSAIQSPAALAILQFQDRFGTKWSHVEQGMVYMRARVHDAAQAERLAMQVRGYLAGQGLDAQVTLQEISPRDFSVWDELVQSSVGLAP
jgi:hypothetical protein